MPYVPNRKGLEVLPNPAQLQEAKNYKIETFRRVDLDNAVVRLKAELIASNPVLCASRYDKSYWMNGVNYNNPPITFGILSPKIHPMIWDMLLLLLVTTIQWAHLNS
jgi:hypothetical protein